MMRFGVAVITFFLFPLLTQAWENDELEIFDLVEEINQNFYEYMGIPNDASTSDVRKAYRRLSLVLHPDRNSAEDASEKFRWLASIYEVLKEPEKRAIYDRVLVEGLPDWKMPIYYYRRMRKMGLAEGLAYTLIIATICQYFINWAAYWEKRFTLKENLSSQINRKKINKKLKKGGDEEEVADKLIEEQLNVLGPKPTCYDTLPFQLFRLGKYIVVSTPALPSTLYSMYKERKEKQEEEERLIQEEEEERSRREAEKKERKERQKQKKMETQLYRDRKKSECPDEVGAQGVTAKQEDIFNRPANANQIWTDDDLAKLTKLMKKYPGGTNDRWEKIAEILERYPSEVTKMAQNVKTKSYMIPVSRSAQGVTGLESKKLVSDDVLEVKTAVAENGDDDSDDSGSSDDNDDDSDNSDYAPYTVATKDDYVPVEIKSKKKTKGGQLGGLPVVEDPKCGQEQPQPVPGQEGWNQTQQKALEAALQQYPKGSSERWDRVAAKVSGKSKEECMLRVRYLAEVVRMKREAAA